MAFQYLIDYALGHEKTEVEAKSLEALARMGHKDLKLNEHECLSLPMWLGYVKEAHLHRFSCHRLRNYTPR